MSNTVSGNKSDVVERIVHLWNSSGGWIPGASYERLAEVLGVSTDRLIHYDWEKHERYYPEGVNRP